MKFPIRRYRSARGLFWAVVGPDGIERMWVRYRMAAMHAKAWRAEARAA
jgi:hypothetical protein